MEPLQKTAPPQLMMETQQMMMVTSERLL